MRGYCVFLHSHCLCPSWAVPSPTPVLYVDSPLITFKWPSGPHTQHASSMETVCYRTKDTLFLREQHPSSKDLFMCQLDGRDTPFLAFIYTLRSCTLSKWRSFSCLLTDLHSLLNIVHAHLDVVDLMNYLVALLRNNRDMPHRFKLVLGSRSVNCSQEREYFYLCLYDYLIVGEKEICCLN